MCHGARVATLRSFDCESAVPQERDESKSGRLSLRMTRFLFYKF